MAAASCLAVLVASCGGPSDEAPVPPAPSVVDLRMSEYRFDYERSIPPGRVVFRVHNRGRRRHEVILVPLPENFPPIEKQLRSNKRHPLGTLAFLHPLRPGARESFAVDLAPGRYGIVDFLEGSDGKRYALKGMTSEFRVR